MIDTRYKDLPWGAFLCAAVAAVILAECGFLAVRSGSRPIDMILKNDESIRGEIDGDLTESEAERVRAEARRDAVLAEIGKFPNHAWAGDYYHGTGTATNNSLLISPQSYAFESGGCTTVYDRNHGAVVQSDDGQIHLFSTFEKLPEGSRGIEPDFIPVSWGARQYLIPANDVIGFCNDVNKGFEPRPHMFGSYFLRKGDEHKEVTGFPDVPDEYRDYLLAKPIEASIVAVGVPTTRPYYRGSVREIPVALDAGSRHGVRVGMELSVTRPERMYQSVRVTKVEADRTEGVITQFDDNAKGPTSGWRVSTSVR